MIETRWRILGRKNIIQLGNSISGIEKKYNPIRYEIQGSSNGRIGQILMSGFAYFSRTGKDRDRIFILDRVRCIVT